MSTIRSCADLIQEALGKLAPDQDSVRALLHTALQRSISLEREIDMLHQELDNHNRAAARRHQYLDVALNEGDGTYRP